MYVCMCVCMYVSMYVCMYVEKIVHSFSYSFSYLIFIGLSGIGVLCATAAHLRNVSFISIKRRQHAKSRVNAWECSISVNLS